MNSKILRLSFEVIGDKFLDLINTSLEKGCFPKKWKLSTIVPIEKVRRTRQCEEYRPINMVPTYEKLLETVANNQMREYVEQERLLTNFQAGFRRKHSCESALQTVISRWKSALSEGRVVGVVFIDFRRAFETINRELLILKLQKYGIEGSVLKWFTEYLQARSQQTKYNGEVSTVKENKHGVPQGTVMGPDLFVLYINDIVNVINNCELQLFADDTILFIESEDVESVVQKINGDLVRLYKWLCSNSLSVNVNKTKVMILKSRYNLIDTYNHSDFLIDNKKIVQVKEFKYLGVVIDENLTFTNHADYIIKKVTKKINYLCRIGRNLSSWSKLLIFKTIVLPHFNYCSTIMYMFQKGDVEVLQRRQNCALRHILGCNRRTRVRDMLEATKLLSVKQNILLNTMTVIYKIKNGMYPEHILEKLQLVSDIHNYNTRGRQNFYVACVHSSFAQNSLFHKGLVDFNNLPDCIKNLNFDGFRVGLRKYIVENHGII